MVEGKISSTFQIGMQTLQGALKRCQDISSQMVEDNLLFGPSTINDPETGNPIPVQGYDIDTNREVLSYISQVWDSFDRYYDCISDLFFFEVMFSPETYPEFPRTEQLSQYLKITYQNWLIKAMTCFDCTLQALNTIFELGIPFREVNRKTFANKRPGIMCSSILPHVEKLDLFLKATVERNTRLKSSRNIQLMRNKIIHTNEFEHTVLSELALDITSYNWGLDMDAFDLQARIGSIGMTMRDEVQTVNRAIFTEVYPIFEYLGLEYQKRFKEKLVQ